MRSVVKNNGWYLVRRHQHHELPMLLYRTRSPSHGKKTTESLREMVRRTWIEFVDGLGSNECKGLDYRDDGVVASTNRLLIMQVVRTSTSMTSTAALREDDDEPRAESDTLRGLLLQSLRQLSHLLADTIRLLRGALVRKRSSRTKWP